MMRKMSFKILALLAVIGLMLCAGAMAEEVTVVASGECGADGANVTWELDSEGTLTISGEGAITDYSSLSSVPWYSYRSDIENVVINEGITFIGAHCFEQYDTDMEAPLYRSPYSFSSITLPKSLIGSSSAFVSPNLVDVYYTGDSFMDWMGLSIALASCNPMSSAENLYINGILADESLIPDHLQSIDAYAFYGLDFISSLDIFENVTFVGEYAFYGCVNLKNVYVDNLEHWMNITFENESANPLYYAENLYVDNVLTTDIIIPEGITSISSYTFQGYDNLKSLIILNSVMDVGRYAFRGCSSLTRVMVPQCVISGGGYGIVGGTFDEYFNSDLAAEIIIADGVATIGREAFKDCSKLKSVTIPSSVTTVDYDAFVNCRLTNVCAESLESWCQINFRDETANPMYYADDLYVAGKILSKTINIPDGVTRIGNYAFAGFGLTSITFPDSVTSIGYGAFYRCSNLRHITLSQGIKSIGSDTFRYCQNLENIIIPDGVTSIGSSAFQDCYSLTSINIPEGITTIGSSAFQSCYRLTSINIPASVGSIGIDAFKGCSNLKDVYASSIENWMKLSFEYWVPSATNNPMEYAENLYFEGVLATNIIIPDTVTSIGYRDFYYCNSLKSVAIPDTVTSIGREAFYSENLDKVIFYGNDMPSMDTTVFATDPTIYCYEFSDVDFWAMEQGYTCVYLDDMNMTIPLEIDLPENRSLLLNSSIDISGCVFPQTATNVNWTSTAPEIISVENGVITALSTGEATITATYGEISDSITIMVYANITLPDDCMLNVGEKMTVVPIINPSCDNVNIIWESSSPEIISVEDGILTAHSEGEVTITATWYNVSDSMVVTANYELTDFHISPPEMWIISKETALLKINKEHPNAESNFSYMSSDTSVLTVDNGAITAKVPGDAVVTVTSDNGIARQCIVHVCYPVIAIAFEDTQIALSIGESAQLTANVTTRNETLVNKLVTFASSDESVVTVDENGVVTAVASGSATISATSSNGITTKCAVIVHNSAILTLPASLTVIEDEAFEGLGVGTVVLPEGATTIGSRAFADCDELTIVHMPDSVVSIADDAFEGCEKVTFLCASENAAAEYAEAHGIKCRIAQ